MKREAALHPEAVDKHAAYRARRAALGLGHTYHGVWEDKVAGFTTHTFSADLSELTTNFVDYTGSTIHSVTTTRGGGAGPSPGPGPGPSPTGKCCYYSDSASACSAGDVCCKSSCKDPSSCSYTESGCEGRYGQKHNCQWEGAQCVVGSSPVARAFSQVLGVQEAGVQMSML